MKKLMLEWFRLVLLILFLYSAGCSSGRIASPEPPAPTAELATLRIDRFLESDLGVAFPTALHASIEIDTLQLDPATQRLDVYFNDTFSYIPFREQNTMALYEAARTALGAPFQDYALTLYALGQPIEALIPNAYRNDPAQIDRTRLPFSSEQSVPIVRPADAAWQPSEGLYNRTIALWPSHGWYYEERLDRWEWQRARLFTTVEDLLPMAFVVPYLVPMLENAGANVFLPRERDVQHHEALVDADGILGDTGAYIEDGAWQTGGPGFALGTLPLTEEDNPFQQGGYRMTASNTAATASAIWQPALPATGAYAVYVSYASLPESIDDARYTVHHAGGQTDFLVNQQMGGGTWIYLGTFRFRAGAPADSARVVLTNQSATPGRQVTADAVRFGGGMGNVARGGSTSGRPRFVEAARYYMQFAGMPDTLVYGVSDTDDYRDDYQGRGEWVNYLKGAPFGPNKKRDTKGLGIPIDLSLAFHTDAGITRNDTTVGTLMIYSSDNADSTKFFPDGQSRFASRDFGDMLQTQIVDDLRATYDPSWKRRSIWDKDYSEAYRPNVPAALLELLSHQNYLDMRFALDPRFRFDVSRSIYKAILRFLATQHGTDYVVQPLPPTHFQADLAEENSVTLRWQPQPDPLEPTADATHYLVYTRRGDGGFDNGVLVDSPQVTLGGLEPDVIYSYKVTAVNAGGESLPSEILAVCQVPQSRGTVLIVNGFDRVAPPAALEEGDMLGFAGFHDQGVPDRYDLSFTGAQFEFNASSDWEDDDAPGHGASYGDYETTVIAGNTFDFPYLHGLSVRAAGYSFVSASDEAIMAGTADPTRYPILDLILGEEKTTPWPKPTRAPQFEAWPEALRQAVRRFTDAGGGLFVSGAYVGTDLLNDVPEDDPATTFAREVLHLHWRTDHAATTEGLITVDTTLLPLPRSFSFNTTLGPTQYAVESPDAVEPADSSAVTILRYAENNLSAAIAAPSQDVVVFGFPFEAITTQPDRDAVMRAVLRWFE